MEPPHLPTAAPPPHALLVPCPAQGHITPLMHLSQNLARRGFVVTFVNTQHNHQRLLRNRAPQEPGLDIRFVSIPDGLQPDHPRTAKVPLLCEAIVKMGPAFEELVERLTHEEPPITCIVSDVFMLFTQDVANKFGIPRAAFWTQSAVSYIAHLLTAKAASLPQIGGAQTLEGAGVLSDVVKMSRGIDGLPDLRVTDMPGYLDSFDPSDFMFDFVTGPFLRLDEAAWILMNTLGEMETTALESLRKLQKNKLHIVGPVLPTDFLTGASVATTDGTGLLPEESCLNWLDKQAPNSVLYIAFGSIAVLDRQQVQEIALALEACQHPFLWVVRPDWMCGESAVFPEGFTERMGSKALFIPWAPQLQVLSHPSVGAFLTHCGWNSTLESISRGVPMLCWPYFGDQMLHCRCVVDWWKIGMSLRGNEEEVVLRGEVERKVRALMEEEAGREMRGRACVWKEAARRAIENGGWAAKDLDLFIDDILSQRALIAR